MKKSALLFSLMVFLLYGCATMPNEADLKESLRSTAEEYWELRIQDKYEETYRMEERTDLPQFDFYRDRVKLIKNFDIQSHSIEEITVEGNNGSVKVRFSFIIPQAPSPVPFSDFILDQWVFKNRRWWHVLPSAFTAP